MVDVCLRKLLKSNSKLREDVEKQILRSKTDDEIKYMLQNNNDAAKAELEKIESQIT